jgi:hypothetical protein
MRGGEALQLSLNRAVESRGLRLHPDDPAWRQLELRFIAAQRKAFDGIKARLNGDTVPTPNLSETAGETGETISGALRRWVEGGSRAARRPRTQSIAEAQRAVHRFIELQGDLPLASITKAHGRQFRDALAKVPKQLPHELSKLPLPALLKKDLSRFPARNAQTVNKTLALIGAVLARADRDGFLRKPAKLVKPLPCRLRHFSQRT